MKHIIVFVFCLVNIQSFIAQEKKVFINDKIEKELSFFVDFKKELNKSLGLDYNYEDIYVILGESEFIIQDIPEEQLELYKQIKLGFFDNHNIFYFISDNTTYFNESELQSTNYEIEKLLDYKIKSLNSIDLDFTAILYSYDSEEEDIFFSDIDSVAKLLFFNVRFGYDFKLD